MKRSGYIKRRTPLPRPTKPIARRSPVKRKAGGTKHSNRPREWGFMSFARDRGCELNLDRDLQRVLKIAHVCEGERQFAHLSDKKRYDTGDVGSGLCESVHEGIDGNRVGGKPDWYVALGKLGQKIFRERLSQRARRAWDLLSPEERAGWERKAEAWRASMRRAA